MSRIPELGEGYSNLPSIIAEYEDLLSGVEEKISIKGKSIEHANRENPTWQLYYDQKRIELHTLVRYLESQMSRVRGKLFRSYTEAHQRELSDRAKDKYIDNEDAFLAINELYLEIKEVYDKYQAVCDAYKSRGYALNNITKVRVASLEDAMI